MHESINKTKSPQIPKPTLRQALFIGGLCLILSLMGLVLVYRLIWGFGGLYTQIRYIPTPENLIRDEASSLIDIDGLPGQRRYWVEQTVDELIAFNQRALPEAGWQIVAEGPNPPYLSEHPYYCIIAQQRGVMAYIDMGQGATPDIAAAHISINIPNSLCEHLLE